MIKLNKFLHTTSMCVLFATLLLFSCDKDVSDVGGNVLTSTDIIQNQLDSFTSETENISLATIQSNGFSGARFLGTSKNDNSGTVNYGLLYRVEPTQSTALTDVSEGQIITSIKIKSANLILPYTYELLETSSDTVSRYRITNIVNEGEPINIDVFNSNFNLTLNNGSSNGPQLYYADASDNNISFRNLIQQGETIVEEVVDVNPNNEEFEITVAQRDATGIVQRLSASSISNAFEDQGKTLKVRLDSGFLGEVFANDEGVVTDTSLFTSESFLENFKGIYINPNEANTNLVSISNTSIAEITPKIEITFDIESSFAAQENGEEIIPERTETNEVTLDFNMNRQTVSIIDSDNTTTDFDAAFGSDQSLLIKGGVSSSRIQLFENSSQLVDIFNRNPIINNAALRLYVDVDSNLYNPNLVPNNLWINDFTTGTLISGAQLINGETDNPFYEFTITQYLRNVLNVDSISELPGQNLNLMIGVSVSDNNSEITTQDQVISNSQSLLIFNRNREQRINIGSLLSNQEVPLFGSGTTSESKRPRLIVDFATVN